MQLYFRFDFYGKTKWQFSHADCASSVRTYFLPENLENEVTETIYHCRLLVKAWRGVNHSEYSSPRRDPVEVSKFAAQASEDSEAYKSRRLICLVLCYVRSHFSKRLSKRAILICWPVTRDQSACTDDPNPGKQKSDSRREFQWLRQDDAEGF